MVKSRLKNAEEIVHLRRMLTKVKLNRLVVQIRICEFGAHILECNVLPCIGVVHHHLTCVIKLVIASVQVREL